MDWNSNFVSFILLVKLKCNRDHIYGLNRVLANIVKILKIHYMVIRFFFAKSILIGRGRLPMVIFQLDVVYSWSNQLPQKSVDEKSSPSIAHRSPLPTEVHCPQKSIVIHKPQNSLGGV
jgi:hypothetical protein